ncbi:hypothetical protein SAMN04487765_3742 [Tenacibaculum sp. MAR_2010_89]|uniref:hypothetical protein n=1 Tax=Tenacibaculum sp. MAR_2010_89 TaxID=1250198 RepID=UPI0008975C51|nr:hypothetical protein [Tenacibaculum sp. MAR_2010_89]SEE67503.1 hypothetical protein SAMN04487765_3742 [Tenacibaculum sp. MAR_2010_89]
MKTKSIVVVIIMMIMSLVGNAQNKIEATGNVGVGTTIPGQKLHIEGGHGDSRILLHSRGGGTESKFADLMLWASEPGLTYTGVGIGNNITNATTTPFLRRISNQRGGSYIRFLDAQIMMNVIKNNGETINAFNISNLGNVGLGTTSPKSRLDLGKNYSNPSIYPNKITLWSGGENNYFGFGISTGDLDYFSQSNHRFYTGYNGTPGSEKMVIQSNGNVGIGTTSPNSKLTINNGALSFTGSVSLPMASLGLHNSNFMYLVGGSAGLKLTDDGLKGITVVDGGNVGIGTTQPDMELTVNGKIHAKEVKIDLAIPAPDYVFKSDYKLRSIEEVENFIKEYSHLPEIPSAKEFAKNGVMQAEMDMNLLKKIEELTLYTIDQEKKLKTQNSKIENQQSEIEELKKQNSEIKELKALVQKLLKDKN